MIVIWLIALGPVYAADTPMDLAKASRRLASEGNLTAAYKKSEHALTAMQSDPAKFDAVIPYVLDDLATLSYRLGKLDDALTWSEQAHSAVTALAEKNANHRGGLAHVADNRGTLLMANGQFPASEKYLKESYTLYSDLPGQWAKAGAVTSKLIAVYLETEQLAPAKTLVAENLLRFQQHRAPADDLANLYLQQTLIAISQHNDDLAKKSLAKVKALRNTISKKMRNEIQLVQAQFFIAQSKLKAAESQLNDLLADYQQSDDKISSDENVQLTKARYRLARIYILQGKVVEADPLLKQALQDYRHLVSANHPAIARCLHALAIVQKNLGAIDAAERLYQQELVILTNTLGEEHPTVAQARLEYSLLLTHAGRTQNAKAQSQLAINGLAAGNDPLRLGYAHSSLGFAQFEDKDYVNAKASFEKAIELMEAARGRNSADLPPGLIKLAEIALIDKRHSDASALIDRAIELLESMGAESPYGLIKALTVKAKLHAAKGRHKLAFETAQRYFELLQSRLAINRNNIVNLGLQEQREIPEHFKLYLDLGTHYQQQLPPGRLDDALFQAAQYPHMTRTAAAIKHMATRVGQSDPQLADQLRQRESLIQAWHQAQQSKMEQLGGMTNQSPTTSVGDLEAQIHALDRALAQRSPAFVELTNPKPTQVAILQRVLKPSEALLLQLTDASGTALFLVTTEQVQQAASELTQLQLTHLVRDLRASVDLTRPEFASTNPPTFEFNYAHHLYQQLISPFAATLASREHLILVLDGAMQNLPPTLLVTKPFTVDPFNPTIDYRQVQFLGHQLAMSVSPSVSAFVALRKLADTPPAPKDFIGIGDPDLYGSPADKRGVTFSLDTLAEELFERGNSKALKTLFDPLPDTRSELTTIAKFFQTPSENLYFLERATESNTKSLPLHQYRNISFATHGLLAGEFKGLLEPALVMTPPNQIRGNNDGLLTASEIADLSLNADWVVLSACNSAASDGRPGAEGLSGLAKAFFYAGAKSLLVSHWSVDSQAAALLTVGMFQALNKPPDASKKPSSKAEALRLAMKAVSLHHDEHLAHPAYWSPFVIVGEGN